MRKLKLCLCFILVLCAKSYAQDYYQFGEEVNEKNRFSITPIGGIQIQLIDDTRLLGALKFQYNLSNNFAVGAQYLYIQPTSFLSEFTPEHSAYGIVSGSIFPFENNFGFHATAGLGYEISPTKGLAYYTDGGIDYRIGRNINLQLQYMEAFFASGFGLGVQIKF